MGTYIFSPRGSRKNKPTRTQSDGRISFSVRLKRRALLVIVAVLSISSLVSLVTPATSYAATVSGNTNIATQALTYATYFSLLNCLTDTQQEADVIPFVGPRIKETSVKAGNWWSKTEIVDSGATPGQNFTPRTGGSYLNAATTRASGFTWCNDIVKTAVNLFGFNGDYMAMLCSFVSYRANNSNCQTSDGGTGDFGDIGISANQQRYRERMSARIWPNGIPTLTQNFADKNAALYLYYRTAFSGGCGVNGKLITPVPSGTQSQFVYKNVRIIADDGSSSTADYVGIDRSTSLVVYQDIGNGGGLNNTNDTARISASCGTIGDKLQAGGTLSDAFKTYKTNHPTDTGAAIVPGGQNSAGTGADSTSCAVNGIGWIICPVVTFVSGLADQMFTWISDNFLQTNISFLSTTGSNTGTYIAWGIIRNIANVAFVIVFLIIIFSQLTGVGVANYGIKKMLPRLVIAAILVNISFFVCQLAVDLSNILGYGIKAVFDSIGANVTSQTASLVTDVNGSGGANLWGSLAVGVLVGAGAAAGYAALGSLIAVLLAAVVAIAMIFLILILRQALIILLIVVAPLAFVAFLLPNTEALFTQWRKLFTTLLLLFPIVGLIFGASALASAVLEATYGGSGNTIGQIIAAGTLVIPLFAVPFVLKKSLDGVGQLGSIVGNLGNRAGKAAGQAGQKGFEGSAIARGQALRKQGRENYRTQKFAENVQKRGLRSFLARGPGITGAQRYANQALDRSAFSATEKATAEEAAAAEATITKRLNLTSAQRQDLALGRQVKDGSGRVIADGKRDAVLRRAAIKLQSGASHDEVMELVNKRMTGTDAQVLASSLGAAPNKPAWAGQGVLEQIAQGIDPTKGIGSLADYHIAEAVAKNAYSSEKIATGDKDELAEVFKVASSTLVNPAHAKQLGDNARAIDADPGLAAKVSKNAPSVTDLKKL